MTTIWDDIKLQFGYNASIVNRLIMINVIIFLAVAILKLVAFLSGSAVLFDAVSVYVMLPSNLELLLWRPWTIITYFFYHESIWHILSNMLFLFYFGSLIEEYIGARRLTALYILGGLAGAAVFLLLFNLLPVLGTDRLTVLYGASGAVYACVVGAATLMPNYTFNLILIGPVRIKFIALFYVVLSVVSMPEGNAGGHIAHLGGALLGYVFIRQLRSGRDLGAPVLWVLDFFQRLFDRKPKLKVTSRNFQHTTARPTATTSSTGLSQRSNFSNPVPSQLADGKPTEAEIDDILEKISKTGYESLSKEEKQKLFKASQE